MRLPRANVPQCSGEGNRYVAANAAFAQVA